MFAFVDFDEPVFAVVIQADTFEVFEVDAECVRDADELGIGDHDDAGARATLAALRALKAEGGGGWMLHRYGSRRRMELTCGIEKLV